MHRTRNLSSTLYVRNLSDRVRYEDLRRLFQKYGKLVDIAIPLDYRSRQPKGYSFVEFEDPRDAEEALYRLDRQPLFGKAIEVEFARGDRKTPREMRARDKDRHYDRDRRYSGDRRSRSRERRRRSKDRETSNSRSKTRSRSRSASQNRNKSASRDRSVSPMQRSVSKSPNQRRSPKSNHSNRSRSASPDN